MITAVDAEWISGAFDMVTSPPATNLKRWVLFRCGLFIYRRALVENSHIGIDNLHYLDIIRSATHVFTLAARMERERILEPKAEICIPLNNVDGRGLYGVNSQEEYWSQAKKIEVRTQVSPSELRIDEGRALALDAAREIYSQFGWLDPPLDELTAEQHKTF